MDYKQKYLKYKTKYINLSNQYGFGLPTPNDESPMPTPISSSSSSASALPMPIPVSSSSSSASALSTPISSSSSSASALPIPKHVSSSSSSASTLPITRTGTTKDEEKYNILLERIRRLLMDSRRGELNRYISNASELAVNKSSSIARATIFDGRTREQIISEYRTIISDIRSYKRTDIRTWIALRDFIIKYNSYPEFKSAFKPLYDMALDAMIAIRVSETLGVSLI